MNISYYILYFNSFSPTMWRKKDDIWECKYKNKPDWFHIDESLYETYIPTMIEKYGQKLTSV